MKRRICTLALTLTLAVGLGGHAFAASFSDVPSNAWYAGAVEDLTEAGVMNGTSATTFSPDGQVTRGMAVTVLWRLAGSPAPKGESSLPDVATGDFFAQAAAWAVEGGIVLGLPNGTFGGGDAITREQLAVFFYRYAQFAGEELASGVLDIFSDAGDIQAWAREGVAHAVGAGLMTGGGDGELNPGGPATRAQLAVTLQRLITPAMG